MAEIPAESVADAPSNLKPDDLPEQPTKLLKDELEGNEKLQESTDLKTSQDQIQIDKDHSNENEKTKDSTIDESKDTNDLNDTKETNETKEVKEVNEVNEVKDTDEPKETHPDDDEGSQSIKLVLEDLEDLEDTGEPKDEKKEDGNVDVAHDKVDKVHAVKSVDKNSVPVNDSSSKTTENEDKVTANEITNSSEKPEQKLPTLSEPKKEVENKSEDNSRSSSSKIENLESSVKENKTTKEKLDNKKNVIESEVGIVGLPTAASELLNEAELVTEKSSLPTDETKVAIADRVVRWVENASTKPVDPTSHLASDPAEEVDGLDVDGEIDAGEDDNETKNEEEIEPTKRKTRGRKRTQSNGTNGSPGTATRKSQRVVTSIIRRSIRCLNKMHSMDSTAGNGKKSVEYSGDLKRDLEDEESRKSPKVPQSQQNGAALPEETASSDRNLSQGSTTLLSVKKEKKEHPAESESNQNQSQAYLSKSSKTQSEQSTTTTTTKTTASTTISTTGKPGRPSSQRVSAKVQQQLQQAQQQQQEQPTRETRKRRSAESLGAATANLSSNGNSTPKRLCLDQREQFIDSLIGSDKFTADQLAARSEQLRTEVQDLDELARAKEMEWNEILSLRKLKEEAYLRIERRRQVMGFMESNGPLTGENFLPPASLALPQQSYDGGGTSSLTLHEKEKLLVPKEERAGSATRDRASKAQAVYPPLTKHQYHHQQAHHPAHHQQNLLPENGPKHLVDAQSPEHRQIGEGRQGPIVDVRSIIADYRLRHPETVPRRRGRRMRNSVNVGLGAGGAVVENVGNIDSRPSSTDSCKSSSNVNDPNNAMSFKDVLVQFAKLSQQQGEPIKTPQNYPDVTLHPVTTAPTTQNSVPQTSGSLLHGILTKSQSPRPTTFSPTLARLLTAPERERSAPTITTTPHQTTTQHLLQTYQGANPVSISDFLSSSKARTEITITPVVSNPIQSHSNNLIHVDDGEEETSIIEERESRLSIGARDNREDRDSPPRCQGCHERSAQFVCAGCGNQWYCSRECQVAAWDEHSDLCSG